MPTSASDSARRRPIKAVPAGKRAGSTSTALSAALGALSLEVVEVDAALAKEWMDRNRSNRAIRKRKVLEFKRDMLADNWRSVGDPLRFDVNDDLVDGQHRLLALIGADAERAGITVMFIVIRGVQPDDRHVIDLGTRRTAGDQLKMAGYKHYALLAAAAKWCLLYERRVMYAEAAVRTVTHPEIMDYVKTNPGLTTAVGAVSNRLKGRIDMPGGYVATGYHLCSMVDPGQAEEFFERLADGVGLPSGDPILALRSRLRDLDKQRANLHGDMWLSLLFRAWNARRDGRSLRALPVYKGTVPVQCPELK